MLWTTAEAGERPLRTAAPSGLLWLGLAAAGLAVHDLERTRQWVATASERELLLIAVAIVLVAIAVGLAITVLGQILETVWLAASGGRLGELLTARRRNRWQQAADDAVRASEVGDAPAFQRATRRRNRICLAKPRRPTWMGDRVAALETRVHGEYGLDLASTWPRLWLILASKVQSECRWAQLAWQRAKVVSAWGLLFLLVGIWWWPAFPIGASVYAIGWSRARAAIEAFATLVEAIVDLHGSDLPSSSGVEPEHGRLLTVRYRKGT